MNGKFRLLFLVAFIILMWKLFRYFAVFQEKYGWQGEPEDLQILTPAEKIRVTVYYEALCSDSRSFFVNHLVPTYDKLQEYLELDFVPYGKATTIENNGEYSFQCQHGVTECEANKIHACALLAFKDPDEQLKYITCMIRDNLEPERIAKSCLKDFDIPYSVISQCANGQEAVILLKEHGKRTHAVKPEITFIPTIELDGDQKVPLAKLLKNFEGEVCKAFLTKPKECL